MKRKSERRAAPVYTYIYIYGVSAKVGRCGMKRGDFPSAVYVAFLLPVAACDGGGVAAAVAAAAGTCKTAESGPNRARRVLITNNYEC